VAAVRPIVRGGIVRPIVRLPSGPVVPVVMPYTLDFLTGAWRTEGGANWSASSLGMFVASGHVTYDAETPNAPTWSARLLNATPTIAGDVRVTGYVSPFAAAPQQCQIQALKLSAPLGSGASGYAVFSSNIGGAVGSLLLLRIINDVVGVVATPSIVGVASLGGVWLKIQDLGGGSVRVRTYAKESGIWVVKSDVTEATAAAVASTPLWLFNTDNSTPALTPQVYHANRVELTADGALV
jgi:hypothetical protein